MEIFIPIDFVRCVGRPTADGIQKECEIIVPGDACVGEGRGTGPPEDFTAAYLPAHHDRKVRVAVDGKLQGIQLAPESLRLHGNLLRTTRELRRKVRGEGLPCRVGVLVRNIRIGEIAADIGAGEQNVTTFLDELVERGAFLGAGTLVGLGEDEKDIAGREF